jgi:hypothetical protein
MTTPALTEPETSTPARRLTLSEIVTQLLARSSGERSTVSLARNARGVTQIEVIVRTGDTEHVRTAADAEREAVAIYDRLRATYPLPPELVVPVEPPPATRGREPKEA